MVIHPGHKGLLVSGRSELQGVGGEADEIEVSLHEVEDEGLPRDLFVLGGHVILPLGLNDALPQVLGSGTLGEGPADVNDPVNLLLSLDTSGKFLEKLLDDIELSLDEGILIILRLGEGTLELLEDQIVNCGLGHQVYGLHFPKMKQTISNRNNKNIVHSIV